jgi:hypothetical protein
LNKANVPIVARLRALQTPARVTPGGARVIAEATAPSPLTALLREVNETILGRALRFESGGGASLTLEASGRRVLRVADAQGLPGAETCLAAGVLEDEHKDDLIKLMQAIAVPRHELRVSISAREVVGEGVSVGLPVALLADLLLADLNDPTGADEAGPATEPDSDAAAGDEGQITTGRSLARFVDAFGPTLMAWVIRGGDADGSCGGVEEMVSHLQGFLDEEVEALHSQLDLVSGQPGRPACVVLGTALVEGQGVLCARSDAAIMLALFDGSPGLSLLNAWEAART